MTVRIVTTPEAEDQIRAIDSWWLVHRPAAPKLFTEELAAGLELLAGAPHIGRRYPHPELQNIRRLLLRSTRYHIYYTVYEASIIILAVWSALRGAGPDLKRLS